MGADAVDYIAQQRLFDNGTLIGDEMQNIAQYFANDICSHHAGEEYENQVA